ncbi:MAG: hypothetical protein ACI89D_000715 [Bermanella sp.]
MQEGETLVRANFPRLREGIEVTAPKTAAPLPAKVPASKLQPGAH